jgi:hypothetical protein
MKSQLSFLCQAHDIGQIVRRDFKAVAHAFQRVLPLKPVMCPPGCARLSTSPADDHAHAAIHETQGRHLPDLTGGLLAEGLFQHQHRLAQIE